MGSEIQAKRAAPAKLQPIVSAGMKYSSSFESKEDDFAVYLIGQDNSTSAQAWKTKLFEKAYDKTLEKDVQDIHLKSLILEKDHLIAKDERGQTYEVDSKTGKLLKPSSPISYRKGP